MSFQLQFVVALILMSLISIKCNDPDEEPVELMTTQEPIDTDDDKTNNFGVIFTTSIPGNCSMYSMCATCGQNNCSWVTCRDVLDDYYQCTETVGHNCTVSSCEQDACKNVTDCEQCGKTGSCEWVECNGSEDGPFCGKAAELCNPLTCNATAPTTTAHPNDNITTVSPIETTTVSPNDTTTTAAPPDTTTSSPNTTTSTPPPDTTTSTPPPDTTTSPPSPNTTTSPPSPDTTTSPPSPDTTTSSPSPDTTTTAPSTTTPPGPAPTPSPQSGGFSAGSFFGGITLTLALLGVGLGGYKFYKTRYDVNYRTL